MNVGLIFARVRKRISPEERSEAQPNRQETSVGFLDAKPSVVGGTTTQEVVTAAGGKIESEEEFRITARTAFSIGANALWL